MAATTDKTKDKNILLNIVAGHNFPFSSKEKLVIRARLGEEWLETHPVSSSAQPTFGVPLVWEVDRWQLSNLRSLRASIWVEAVLGDQSLGHQVLDIRSAIPAKQSDPELPKPKPIKLIGSKLKPAPELEMNLILEEPEAANGDDAELEREYEHGREHIGNISSETIDEDLMTPILEEEQGHIRIGPEDQANQAYEYRVTVIEVQNLDLLPAREAEDPNVSDPGYVLYINCFGSFVGTDTFERMNQPFKVFVSLRSSEHLLRQYLKANRFSIVVFRNHNMIGYAEEDVSEKLFQRAVVKGANGWEPYYTCIPVIAAGDMRVPKEGGKEPKIGLQISVTPASNTSLRSISRSAQDEVMQTESGALGEMGVSVSEGQLTDTDMTSDNDNRTERQTVAEDRLDLSRNKDGPSGNAACPEVVLSESRLEGEKEVELPRTPVSPPTRIPRPTIARPSSARVSLFPTDADASDRFNSTASTHPGDVTDYISPPAPKQARIGTTSAQSNKVMSPEEVVEPSSKSEAFMSSRREKSGRSTAKDSPRSRVSGQSKITRHHRAYRFSIELLAVEMLTADYRDLVVYYKYSAVHPEPISTRPGFSARKDVRRDIPRGFCQFEFATHKLHSIFRQHPLKIVLARESAPGNKLGVCVIPLDYILEAPSKNNFQEHRGVVACMSDARDHVANVEFKIRLHHLTAVETPTLSSQVKQALSTSETPKPINQEMTSMLAVAAKDIELWKMREKTKFVKLLQQEEKEHLDLLGKEWKDREIEREQSYKQKLANISRLEEELKECIAASKTQQAQLAVEKEQVAVEKRQLDEERKRVANERTGAVGRLKTKIREMEAEARSAQDTMEKHKQRIATVEQENLRFRQELERRKREKQERAWEAGELDKAQAALNESRAQLELVMKENEVLNTVVTNLKSELSAQEGATIDYESRINQLELQVQQLLMPSSTKKSVSSANMRREESADQATSGESSLMEDDNSRRRSARGKKSKSQSSFSETSSKVTAMETVDEELLRVRKLRHLEETRELLLRTGNYSSDDIPIKLLQQEIDKLRGQMSR